MKLFLSKYTPILLALFLMMSFSQKTFAQRKGKTLAIATLALNAWQKGESTGNYADFKALISDNFNTFSHPLMGKYKEKQALEKMLNLVAEREKNRNNLTFSEVEMNVIGKQAFIKFNSKGTIMNGKLPYEGFNIFVFQIENKKLTGFQEYLGFIDPSWLKN